MSGYGMIVSATLLGDTPEECLQQCKLYEHKVQYTQGPVWSTEKAPRWKRHGKYAVVVTYMNTSDTE
jgi:hypothetical protein